MNFTRTLAIFLVLSCFFGSFSPAQTLPDPSFVVNEAAYYLPHDRLDPHKEFYLPWDNIYRCLYETPLRCDPNSDILQLEPHLLVSLPTLDDDGILLRMQFRKDVFFADDPCFENGKGRAMTAHDFAYVIKRHIDPRTKSPYYGSYLGGYLLGARRARARAIKNGFLDYTEEIPGIKVIDDYRIEMKFLSPYSRFPALMTMTWLSIIPHEAIRKYGSGISTHPVGTGPYLLDRSQDKADELVFKPNPKYWDAKAGKSMGPLPWNAGVRFRLIPDNKVQEKRFIDGDLTVIDLYPIQLERLLNKRGRLISKLVPRRTKLLSAKDDKLQYIAFNMKNKILGKKKVRHALTLALDRSQLVKDYFIGMADLANHICPPAIPLFNRKDLTWKLGQQDLDKAKKLLAEAGYPDGKGLPEFVLETANSSDWEKALTVAIKESWAKLGVKIQIRLQTYPALLERIRLGQPEISINYWQSDYPDSENFFMMLTRNSWPEPGKTADSPNVGFYENQEYEALYKKSTKLVPGLKRGAILEEMVKIIQDDCPWVFLGHNRQSALVAPKIRGIYSRSRFSSSYARVWRPAPKKRRN